MRTTTYWVDLSLLYGLIVPRAKLITYLLAYLFTYWINNLIIYVLTYLLTRTYLYGLQTPSPTLTLTDISKPIFKLTHWTA